MSDIVRAIREGDAVLSDWASFYKAEDDAIRAEAAWREALRAKTKAALREALGLGGDDE